MKKALLCCIVIMLAICCFALLTACDKEQSSDDCEIKFVTVSGGTTAETYTTKVARGQTIGLPDYLAFVSKPGPDDIGGHYNYTGLFWDEACFHKRDDSLQVTDDMTLYVKKCSESTSVVDFILDGETYTLIPDESQNLSVTDFVTTAYGKYADASDFKFYKDKEMTQEISFEGLAYTELNLSFWNRYTVYVKRISA